jgi:hypothetical protein
MHTGKHSFWKTVCIPEFGNQNAYAASRLFIVFKQIKHLPWIQKLSKTRETGSDRFRGFAKNRLVGIKKTKIS